MALGAKALSGLPVAKIVTGGCPAAVECPCATATVGPGGAVFAVAATPTMP
jgi:hypothetical protein